MAGSEFTSTHGKRHRVQMADIARLAGVGVSTVSRALRDHASVNQSTRTRIAEIARSLDYQPNLGARSLRTGKNRVITAVLPETKMMQNDAQSRLLMELVGSLSDALACNDYEMHVTRCIDGQSKAAIRAVQDGRSVGVVMMGLDHQVALIDAFRSADIPFVCWGARFPGQRHRVVGGDYVGGGKLAAEHLLSQGCRTIGFLGDVTLPDAYEFCEGYEQALRQADLAADPSLRAHCVAGEDVSSAVVSLLQQHPLLDGLITGSEVCAQLAIRHLQQDGRSVPHQVAVVAKGNMRRADDELGVITTVDPGLANAGNAMLSELFSAIVGGRAQSHRLPMSLSVRTSSMRMQ